MIKSHHMSDYCENECKYRGSVEDYFPQVIDKLKKEEFIKGVCIYLTHLYGTPISCDQPPEKNSMNCPNIGM